MAPTLFIFIFSPYDSPNNNSEIAGEDTFNFFFYFNFLFIYFTNTQINWATLGQGGQLHINN